ncbi:MAG: hypothetical protein ALECFALPRED_000146 [Alectoria fallacina]|uniref:HECT-type E3 ubiquitin transferase n=1 Tax=Alectoria fallacina TaxID=1903189 RepID=A0A8H3I134_9LECA|nr:MAG: hypothetical protein ALECFALPRED_000146 [Alectoria fallacina]
MAKQINREAPRLSTLNKQILYGCKNPRCETTTCLSRQKRVAKGPFRPYTVLSARTLATFLASQDHPERGLCPHQPVDIDPGPRSPVKEVKPAGKKPESGGNLLASSRSSHATSIPQSARGVGSTLVQGRKIKVHIAHGHTKTLGLKPETSRAGSYEEPKSHNHVSKDKDPKSFTQNLFDTVAMKLLHRASSSDNHPPWAPSYERAQLVGSSNLNSDSLPPKTYGDISKNDEKDAERPLVPDTESAKAAHGCNLHQIESVPNVVSIGSNTTSSEVCCARGTVRGSTKLEKCMESFETSGNNGKAHVAVNIEAKESALGAATAPSKFSQPDYQPEKLDVAETAPMHKTSISVAIPSETTPNLPTLSLSHFTSANIIALKGARAVRRSDLYEQHWLLKFLGRTDLPQHSSRCGPYGDFLAYSGQSMTYILSNVDAILQSFLHSDDSSAASKVIWSYDFASIVDLFRKLRRIDMHPPKIFPSLWISAGRLYPVSKSTNKRRSLMSSDLGSFSLDPSPTSHCFSLNDLEACHVVKIILAALVASVPKCSPISWLAVRKLHASGQVAPFIDADNSPAEQKMIGKLVKTLQAFENEMALRLVVRLTRSIDIRYHLARARALAEDVEKYRRQFPPTFSQVVDYVNADQFKICVAENKSQSSVKGGEWVDPEIEPITWHPTEWPIIIEWLRAVILKEWDGKSRVAKGSAVGGALGLMLHIHEHAIALRFDWDLFHTPFLSERLDVMDEPAAWLNSGWADGRSVHLLDFPFLFPPSALVAYFRSINHAAMYTAYRDSVAASRLCDAVTWPDRSTGRGEIRLGDRLHYATTEYLVVEARRDHVLMDAMNEIYRRQKRELMRPLKVRMVGEEGIDHGGVQQEFFRVAIAEALNPDYGVFTTDPTTRMSWFHPSSPEPAYKFELLGILVSLAVYNGLTLPFTFPLVMYRKLSGLHNHRLSDLEDGWPELVKGLRALRDWKDGDVEDVFMRSYIFSVDKFGATEDRLIGQYENAKQGDEKKSSEAFEENPKKVVKVVRIKRKPKKVRKTAAEEGEEDALRYLRGSQFQQATAEPNDEVSMSNSQSRVPHSTNFTDQTMPMITSEEEALEYLKNRETKEARVELDDEFCMSDSSSPNPLPAGPALQNAPMVTNENRDQYIHDYIHQLTYKTVYDQFNAFRYGFFTCFNPKAISLFSPSGLKALVEGLPDISVAGLERVTRYDGGYDFFYPTVRQFWSVVHSWSQEKVRKLLEFVTASDRLPVGGVGKLIFTVQKNGIGDGRLPTSLTCFGRLLLPEYTSEEKLREALEKAVENSKGFGQP